MKGELGDPEAGVGEHDDVQQPAQRRALAPTNAS